MSSSTSSSSSSSSSSAAPAAAPTEAVKKEEKDKKSKTHKRRSPATPLSAMELLLQKKLKNAELLDIKELKQLNTWEEEKPDEFKQANRKLSAIKAADKRRRRQKPLKEIRLYQEATTPLLRKLPLQRLVRQIYEQIVFKEHAITDDIKKVRFSQVFMATIQAAVEAEIVKTLSMSNDVMKLRNRHIMADRDVNLVLRHHGYETIDEQKARIREDAKMIVALAEEKAKRKMEREREAGNDTVTIEETVPKKKKKAAAPKKKVKAKKLSNSSSSSSASEPAKEKSST